MKNIIIGFVLGILVWSFVENNIFFTKFEYKSPEPCKEIGNNVIECGIAKFKFERGISFIRSLSNF